MGRPQVAVAAGLGERLAAVIEPWSADQPALDGHRKTDVAAAGVAHGRKTALERSLQMLEGVSDEQRLRHAIEPLQVERGRIGVEMQVDETGHQESPAAVEALRGRQPGRTAADVADRVAFNDDGRPAADVLGDAVEDVAVLENDGVAHRCDSLLFAGIVANDCRARPEAVRFLCRKRP